MMELTLPEIVRCCDCRYVAPSLPNAEIAAVSTDSRTVQPKDLFVALRGRSHDGHEFVGAALTKAAAAMVDEQWFQAAGRPTHLPLMVVNDTLAAYQTIAQHYRRKIDPTVVAITGSAGKTTCKELTHAVLSAKYAVLKNVKSFNNHVGVPATLLQLNRTHRMLVAELGTSAFGEIARLSELVEPDVCVLLNIGFAHLEFLQNREGVARAKMEIFAHAAENAVAVYNADDDMLRRQRFPTSRIVTFGIEQPADVRAVIHACDRDGCYTFGWEDQTVKLPIPGRHSVYNALAAAAVGKLFGVPSADIAAALAAVAGAEHRLQVYERQGVRVIDDAYNANPGSCRAALQTLADMQVPSGGRRIAVLGDMLELGESAESEHEKLADTAGALNLDALFLLGNLMQHTARRAMSLGLQTVVAATHDDLWAALSEFVKAGDLVLVKGSRSMRMETIVDKLLQRV